MYEVVWSVDNSLNHDVLPSFSLHIGWTWIPKSGANMAYGMV